MSGSRRISENWSIQRLPSTGAGPSRTPATASWRNLQASSMRCAARSRCSGEWSSAMRQRPMTVASSFGSASISAM
jgi:hypothetical protein